MRELAANSLGAANFEFLEVVVNRAGMRSVQVKESLKEKAQPAQKPEKQGEVLYDSKIHGLPKPRPLTPKTRWTQQYQRYLDDPTAFKDFIDSVRAANAAEEERIRREGVPTKYLIRAYSLTQLPPHQGNGLAPIPESDKEVDLTPSQSDKGIPLGGGNPEKVKKATLGQRRGKPTNLTLDVTTARVADFLQPDSTIPATPVPQDVPMDLTTEPDQSPTYLPNRKTWTQHQEGSLIPRSVREKEPYEESFSDDDPHTPTLQQEEIEIEGPTPNSTPVELTSQSKDAEKDADDDQDSENGVMVTVEIKKKINEEGDSEYEMLEIDETEQTQQE